MFNEFSRDFLARVAVTQLNWQMIEDILKNSSELDKTSDSEDHILNCQEDILNATVCHPLCIKYPPPYSYIQKFLRTLITKIEMFNCEMHSTILEKFTALLVSNKCHSPDGYRTFQIEKDTTLSLKENISIISDGTTGLCTWQAAFFLAEWCLHNKHIIKKKKIFELGSGSGLVGLTCFKKCDPSSVTLTDFHPKVLETLASNIKDNVTSTSSNHIEVESLDWVEFSKNLNSNSNYQADIVLASDVVYDIDLIPALVGSLHRLLDVSNRESSFTPFAVIACTIRNEDTMQNFLAELVEHGMAYQLLDHAPQVFSCDRTYPVNLFQITRT